MNDIVAELLILTLVGTYLILLAVKVYDLLTAKKNNVVKFRARKRWHNGLQT